VKDQKKPRLPVEKGGISLKEGGKEGVQKPAYDLASKKKPALEREIISWGHVGEWDG